MAIGFNLQGIPGQIRGTPEEAGAVPDLGQLMMQGFSNSLDMANKPRTIAQDYLTRELNNKIRNAQARYAEPMAKTGYDQALANLQQQNLVNKYYGRMRESELSGQGLTQEHQRMVNEQLRRTLDRQKRYDELLEYYRQQGATPEQAHSLAIASVNQTHPEPQEAPQQQQDLAQTILGASIPDYLSNIAPQPQGQTAPFNAQNAPYTPISESGIGLGYTPFSLKKEMLPGQENALHKLIQQNYDERDAALTSAFGSPLQFGLEQKLQNYLLNKTRSPFKTGLSAEAQGYEGMSPIQAPRLQQQEPLAQTFQLPPAPQAAPEYLQRPEMPSVAVPEEQAPVEPTQPQQPKSYVEQLQQAGYNTTNADSVYAPEDKLYLEHPEYRDLLKAKFPNIGTKQYNDFPRNRIMFTETLPSGATKTTIQPLGGAQGGAPDFKPASPTGKLIEDLHHYEGVGDKRGAEIVKKSIKKSLETGKLEIEQLYDARDKNLLEGNTERANKEQEIIDDYNNKHKSVINIQPKPRAGSTIVTDDKGQYAGYLQPLSKKQIEARTNNARFNTFFNIVSDGVKPYQGTASQVYNQLKNDIANQATDQGAADRLYKLLLAKNVLTSVAASDLKMIDAPKVKNVFASLKSALGKTGVPEVLEGLLSYKIDKEIQNKAQDDTGVVLNMGTDAYNAALDKAEKETTFIPARTTLKDLQGKISTGANVIKAKQKKKPIVLKLTSKGLEKDNG